MKILINKGYGGFGISTTALLELVKRNAKCLRKYEPIEYYGGNNKKFKSRVDWEADWKKDFANYIDMGDGYFAHGSGFNIYKDGFMYDAERNDETRTDPDLIEIVETLKEKSFGMCAKLKVVEIPVGIEYFIDEYDGMEHIAEKHRTWS